MCVLLLHPQQRCAQDEFDAPKDLAKMVAPVPRTSSPGGLPQLREEGKDDGSGPCTFWVICLKSLNSNLCSLHRWVVQHLSIGLFAIPGIHILLFIYCWSRQTRWRLSLIALHMNCALHPKLRTYIVSVRHPFVLFCSFMLQCGAIDLSQMLVSPVAKVMGSRSSLQFPNLLLQSFLTSVACKVNSWPVLLSHNKNIWCSLLFDTAAYEFHLEFGRTVYDSTEIHTENGTKERMLLASICQEIVSDPDMQDQDMLFSCAPVQCLFILALYSGTCQWWCNFHASWCLFKINNVFGIVCSLIIRRCWCFKVNWNLKNLLLQHCNAFWRLGMTCTWKVTIA